MEFEWDQAKSDARYALDGFGFDFAALIFEGPTLEWPDNRRDYGELRMIALGAADGQVLAVVFTDRDDVRRIISARPANRREREKWLSFVDH